MGKWKQVQQYAQHIPNPLDHLKKNLRSASLILVLDATFVRVLGRDTAILIAYDTVLGVIDYQLNRTESKKAYRQIFKRLKKAHYEPICAVSDGNTGLVALLKEAHLPYQRCVRHALQELERLLGKKKREKLTGEKLDIYVRMEKILLTKTIEEVPEKVANFRLYSEHRFQEQWWILRWFWKILPNALLHLSYAEKVPNTTNILENFNGQIKQRLKTMRGMKSKKSLKNLLKILFYFRNYK